MSAVHVGAGAVPEIDVRLKLSALWISTSCLFVTVDMLGLFRGDVAAAIAAGEIAGFTLDRGFLLAAVCYLLPPAMMVPLSLLLPSRIGRLASLCLAPAYAVSVVAFAVGEWGYYLLASVVEVALLVTIGGLAWRWKVGTAGRAAVTAYAAVTDTASS